MSDDLTIKSVALSPEPSPLLDWNRKFTYFIHLAGNLSSDGCYPVVSRIYYFVSTIISAVAMPLITLAGLYYAGKNLVKGNFEKAWSIFAEILPKAEKYLLYLSASAAGVLAPASVGKWLNTAAPSLSSAVDDVSYFFATPNDYASQGLKEDSQLSRVFYLMQIVFSILGLLGIVLAAIKEGGQQILKGNFKDSFVSILSIIPNAWIHVKLLGVSAVGLVLPLSLSRKLRGIAKETKAPSEPAPPLHRESTTAEITTIATDLILDCCNFFSWIRKN